MSGKQFLIINHFLPQSKINETETLKDKDKLNMQKHWSPRPRARLKLNKIKEEQS